MRQIIIAIFIMLGSQVNAEVLMHCGSSKGQAYIFNHPIFNSEPSGWHKDGINNGRIILTKDGDNWDILFGDAAGSSGYRSDGATVILLAWTDEFIRLGAFANNYSDVYNFNLKEKTVAWTSNKSGPLMGKAAVYLSSCR